jgi:POT family proton-dependent oligopeptide transporter
MPVAVRDDRQLFGHPRGLTVLAGTEVWERFSFYGMQALLLLYMTKYLLLPEHASKVLGLDAARSFVDGAFGHHTDLGFATMIYGIYSGLIYATPLLGAWLGDRVIGRRRTVALGCVLMAAGHLSMASEHLFLLALLLIVTGAGGVIGNMYAQVGQLYAPEDDRRTRAFGIYLIMLNVGALVAPLVIGTLGEKVGWHYGFAAAGVGMVFGLIIYLSGQSWLPADRIAAKGSVPPLTSEEKRRVRKLLWLYLPYLLSNIPSFMAYGLMYVWADKAVDLDIGSFRMPVTWIGFVDGVLTIVGVWVATRIWLALEKRGRPLHDLDKIAIGYGGLTLAWVFAAAIALLPEVPVLLWIAFFLLLDFSFGWFEAPTNSIVTRDAPASTASMMVAILKATVAVSYFSIGSLGEFYEPMGAPAFWLLTAGFAFAAFVAAVAMRGYLKRAFAAADRSIAPDLVFPVAVEPA